MPTIPRVLFATTLALAYPALGAPEEPPLAPDLATIPIPQQRIAPLIQRFRADLASVEHVHALRDDGADGIHAPRRAQVLQSLYRQWRQRIAQVPFESLAIEDRIDYVLFARELDHRLSQLDFDRERFEAARPLLPGIDALIALAEARRALEYPDPKASAEALERARKQVAARLADIEKDGVKARGDATAVEAYRAARILDATRAALKDWYGFHAGYDPQFTWWTKQPYEALDKLLEQYAKAVRDKLAGASDPETIVGDPIGREALLAGLRYEMIPYTPEELIDIGERELAWCQRELAKEARRMGFDDWHAALEEVKRRHVAPGEQPKLAAQLATEAIDYVTQHDLVTVPELARHDWRMTMLSPESQLQAPFFLGGEDVWVAFPTDSMPHDKKLMSLRGNNRHFSRAVVHHELIPGHHLQYFYNTRWQPHRQLFDTPFWGEGWALYWELLLYERGFASTPEDRIGMLFWRSHRAARILFSLSFHLGRMTPQQAVDLLVERVGHERENAAAEVRRSFAGDYGPLYQAGYLLGGLQIRALRRELVETGRMTDCRFHDAILEGGPMPIEMVRARLLDAPPTKDAKPAWRFYDTER